MFRLVITLLALLAVTGCGLPTRPSEAEKWFADPAARELATAVARGDRAGIVELVDTGADPDATGVEDLTLLQFSILTSSIDGMAGLLDAGADPDKVGRGGVAPLSIAAFDGGLPFVELLLSSGADPNVQATVTGSTPLKNACFQRDVPVFTALLDAGADPDAADRNSDGVIHTCARVNAGDLLLLLLQRGADPEARTSAGASFQDYYFSYAKNVLNERSVAERAAIIAWLEDHGIPVVPEAYR